MILPLSLVTSALAGTGPWTLPEGNWSVYGGAEYHQFSTLVGDAGAGFGGGDPMGTTFRTFALQGVGSFGLRDWAEAELSIPYDYVQASRTDVETCAVGLDACEPTTDIGLVSGRLKLRVLDEVRGPPITLSLGPVVRSGEFTHAERTRFTGPTEGQTDFGAFAVLGRSSGLAQGWYGVWGQAEYRHRLGNTEIDGGKVPADEVEASAELMLAPFGDVAFGPDVWYATRDGVTLETMLSEYVSDPDRFAMLAVSTLKVGGKVIVGSRSLSSLVLSGTVTAWARNNPTDNWSIAVGVNHQFVPKDTGS